MVARGQRAGYPSDLTDEQWAVLEPLVHRASGPGRIESPGMV